MNFRDLKLRVRALIAPRRAEGELVSPRPLLAVTIVATVALGLGLEPTIRRGI